MRTNKGIAMVLVALSAAALLMSACGSKGVSKGDTPDWYLNPPKAADKIYGVGASDPMASLDFSRQVADQRSREALGQVIQVSVQNMLRTFMQQSGTMDNTRAIQFAETVSKQVTNVSLSGSTISRREIRGGRTFALAEISQDSIKNALLTATRDAAAQYSEAKAKEAFQALEKEINKGSIPVTQP